MGGRGDLSCLSLGLYRRRQAIRLCDQIRLGRRGRQRRQLRPHGRGELAHLGVFRLRHYLSALHRAGVVHGDVVQQLPGLARIDGLGMNRRQAHGPGQT